MLKASGQGLPTSSWLLPSSAALHWEDGRVCEMRALEILPKTKTFLMLGSQKRQNGQC